MFSALTLWSFPTLFWIVCVLGNVDHAPKLVEVVVTRTNGHTVIMNFEKHYIFYEYSNLETSLMMEVVIFICIHLNPCLEKFS